MSTSQAISHEAVDQVHLEQQPLPLDLLIEALVPGGVNRAIFLQRAQKADAIETIGILDDLDLTKNWADRRKAIYRGREILKNAYSNYPLAAYSNGYIEKMLQVLPRLFLNSPTFSAASKPDKHLYRLNHWLDGLSAQEIQVEEGLSYNAVSSWKSVGFPAALSKNLPFFDVAHAADYLSEVESSLLIG